MKEGEKEGLEMKFKLKVKRFNTLMEEMKQRILAKSYKIKRYNIQTKQLRDNMMLTSNQGKFFKSLQDGDDRMTAPNPEDAI